MAQPAAADNDKNLNSAQGDDADDDSDDDDDSDEEVAHAPAAKDTPALETRMDRETDSDGNDTIATSTITSAFVGDYLVSLRRDVVAAHDPAGSARAEASFISIHKDLSETFALSGGFGSYRTLYYNDFVGSMVAHWHADDWSISAGIARNLQAGRLNAVALTASSDQTIAAWSLRSDIAVAAADINTALSAERVAGLLPNPTLNFVLGELVGVATRARTNW